MRWGVAFLAVVACCGLVACASEHPSIRLIDGVFELDGVEAAGTDEWRSVFAVRVAHADADAPNLLGQYEQRGSVLRFTPRFELSPGLAYRATCMRSGRVRVFEVPAVDPGPRVVVRAVYPSASELPENLLRFYVQFSAPVRRGHVYRHVALLDAEQRPIELAFLEIGEELWDKSGTRLTLLLDPGRIKRGLRPRIEEGPILEDGQSYCLRIDAALQDRAGRPLGASFEKRFRCIAADVTQPDPNAWTLSAPRIGTREALVVRFPEALDHALLRHMIDVEGPRGDVLAGDVRVFDGETAWRFRPHDAWEDGAHWLVVDRDLEDRVGNSIRSAFEVDVPQAATVRVVRTTDRVRLSLRD